MTWNSREDMYYSRNDCQHGWITLRDPNDVRAYLHVVTYVERDQLGDIVGLVAFR